MDIKSDGRKLISALLITISHAMIIYYLGVEAHAGGSIILLLLNLLCITGQIGCKYSNGSYITRPDEKALIYPTDHPPVVTAAKVPEFPEVSDDKKIVVMPRETPGISLNFGSRDSLCD